jgi:hypothetical protein
MYRTPESWRSVELTPNGQTENRPGVLTIHENKPLYSVFPLWNPSDNPTLSLLLRIPKIFKWFTTRPDIVKTLCTNSPFEKRDWLHYIEDTEGQGPLNAIGFRQTRPVTISTIVPKAETLIPFEEFDIILPELTTTLSEEAFYKCLDQYNTHPTHALVHRNHSTHAFETIDDLFHCGYKLSAWIDHTNTLHQVYALPNENPNERHYYVVAQEPDSVEQRTEELHIPSVNNAKLMLWQTTELYAPANRPGRTIQRTVDGTYVPPSTLRASAAVIPFREPMSCTPSEIDKLRDEDFPVIAQEKLDGNRIIVHILDCTGMPLVRYFSRNGIVQTEKFNEQFDAGVITFCKILFGRAPYSYRNVMLDCECYAEDVIHSDIGGLCNRIEISDGFRKLKLYVLSIHDLDSLGTEKLRSREYTVSNRTFREVLMDEQDLLIRVQDETIARGISTVYLNYSYEIRSRDELYEMMSYIVEAKGEGIVLYPFDRPYTFANAGLKKIKKIFDGECVVLGYKPSNTNPTEIGSVLVSAAPRFSKETAETVTFYVNAALCNEVKEGSMASARFANCIGKHYTIVCASFSDEGVPIHARFKAPFGPGSERVDL